MSSVPIRVPATAGEAMRPAVTVAEPNDHMAAAAYLMKHTGVTALVIIDDEDARRPVGLITDADIVQQWRTTRTSTRSGYLIC